MFEAGSMRWRLAGVIAVAAVVYLLGNGAVSLWDRDEPRNAQTSRQMLQSGDWVVPRFLGEVRTAKPIFIYWCQASAMAAFGDNAFAARFPSAVAMTLTLVLLATVLYRTVGPGQAFWTVFIFATSLMVILSAKMSLTDSVLLLWVTVGQLCMYGFYRGVRSWKVVLTFWVAVGLAGLTKGPVILGVAGAMTVALAIFDAAREGWSFRRFVRAMAWWGNARPLVGLVVVAAIVTPWLVLVEQRAPGFLGIIIGHDVVRRMTTGLENHKGPPGFYAGTLFLFYLPWVLFLPGAIYVAWKGRNAPGTRFALSMVLGPWVMFELVQTKLPHYLLPIYSSLAFLTADALRRCLRGEFGEYLRPRFVAATVLLCLFLVALGVGPWAVSQWFEPPPAATTAWLTGVAVLSAGVIFGLVLRRRLAMAAVAMGAGTMAIVAVRPPSCCSTMSSILLRSITPRAPTVARRRCGSLVCRWTRRRRRPPATTSESPSSLTAAATTSGANNDPSRGEMSASVQNR